MVITINSTILTIVTIIIALVVTSLHRAAGLPVAWPEHCLRHPGLARRHDGEEAVRAVRRRRVAVGSARGAGGGRGLAGPGVEEVGGCLRVIIMIIIISIVLVVVVVVVVGSNSSSNSSRRVAPTTTNSRY